VRGPKKQKERTQKLQTHNGGKKTFLLGGRGRHAPLNILPRKTLGKDGGGAAEKKDGRVEKGKSWTDLKGADSSIVKRGSGNSRRKDVTTKREVALGSYRGGGDPGA